MAASVDFKTYVDQACRAADEFVNIYYETMDKRRRALTRLYLDKATLVWNGNAVSGQEELNKFFEMLPSSEFQVNVLDCQPVHDRHLHSLTSKDNTDSLCSYQLPSALPTQQDTGVSEHLNMQRLILLYVLPAVNMCN
ncbi:NTF2-related export protein 2 isoform X2 [Motacilla alba alba]|uniref:NTF2-related export protein 2 isoform X2 n=1 Tax=Motacilla alba alba TaxID=1094192 RepID=UPI0018D57CC6|nr:NTF2-related export protein 2 isoform X2 [Motacilla alba alba]